jgi:DNA polymerase-3 subunit delta
MLYILYGTDTFSREEFIAQLQVAIGSPDAAKSNTTRVSWKDVSLPEITQACLTVPFLANRRMVVVEGLLASSTQTSRSRSKSVASPVVNPLSTSIPLLDKLEQLVNELPDTTDLIFAEEALRKDNPMISALGPLAKIREFDVLRGAKLQQWIIQRSTRRGTPITTGAALLLANLIGGDLRSLNNEIEKLALYCHGSLIQEEHIGILVTAIKEANIFSAVDAILDSKVAESLQLIERLLVEGTSISYIFAMLARQIRLVLVAQELLNNNVDSGSLGKRLGLYSEYPLKKTLQQARKLSRDRLRRSHELLVSSDYAMKTGLSDERLGLETLVVQLSILNK